MLGSLASRKGSRVKRIEGSDGVQRQRPSQCQHICPIPPIRRLSTPCVSVVSFTLAPKEAVRASRAREASPAVMYRGNFPRLLDGKREALEARRPGRRFRRKHQNPGEVPKKGRRRRPTCLSDSGHQCSFISFVCEAWVQKRFPVFPCEESELDASHEQILRPVEVRTTLLSSGHKRKDSKCGGEAKEDHAMSNKR